MLSSFPSVLRLALLLLATVHVASIDVQPTSSPDTVTCSLSEYQALYRQAYLKELKHTDETEKKEMRQDYSRRQKELQAEKAALSSSSRFRKERAQVLPSNWQLVNHTAAGVFRFGSEPEESSMATYDFSLDFRIFEDEWTAIPIIDAQSIVGDWVVTRAVANGSAWEDIELGHNTLLVLSHQGTQEEGQLRKPEHTLMTNSSGRYRIRFRAFTYVRNNRNLFTLQLNLLYPLAHTDLRLHHDTSSAHIRELNIEPAAHFEVKKSANHSDISIRLPSSSFVEVKWRIQAGAHSAKLKTSSSQSSDQSAGSSEQDQEPESAQATVQHDSLHSIEDGILQSSHTFKYQLDSASQSLSSVDIIVLSPARVSSVVAHGMQTWRTGAAKNVIWPGQSGDAAVPIGNMSGTLVTVVFKSSVITKEVIVKVSTEQEYDVEVGAVALPVAICQGVLRQTGTLAVVKVANVEVYEKSAVGVVRVGADDVPSHIRGGTDRPIVLAYKYLSPRQSVDVSVIHHHELNTLEAAVDTALHQVLVVDTQMMHTFTLLLQNMQRQYMEIRGIPTSATLWSLKVNTLDTKPVRGRQGALMVPLLVGPQGSNKDGAVAKTSIELAWLSTGEALGENGTLELSPPQVDMPISALSVEVQFPAGYRVNFTGTLAQIDKFSQRQPTARNYETGTDVTNHAFDFNSGPSAKGGSSNSKVGMKAKVPKTGARYLFEKLLVVNGSATLSAAYNNTPTSMPKENGWMDGVMAYLMDPWGQRR